MRFNTRKNTAARLSAAALTAELFIPLRLAAEGYTGFSDALITAALVLLPACLCEALPPRARFLPQLVAVAAAGYVCVGLFAFGEFTWLSETRLSLHFFGLLLVFALLLCVYALSGSARLSACLGGGLCLALAVANSVTAQFRGRLFLFSDLQNLRTALSVAGSYSYELKHVYIPAALLLFAAVLTALCRPARAPEALPVKISLRAVSAAFGVWVFAAFFTGLLMQGTGILITWDDNDYEESPVLYFCEILRRSSVSAPEGYSDEALEEIAASVENGSENIYADESEQPHIIVIMDEAFSDLSRIGSFETSVPVTPFMDELLQTTKHGYVYSSVFGGNTANSEFELLTGCTMAFVPAGSTPYQVYLKYEKDSLVSVLEAQGYKSAVMHPYGEAGYNRVAVYGLFGFDDMMFIDDFTDKSYLRGYVTDESDFENLISYYESRGEDERLFLLNITMQNHGGYKNERYESTVSIVGHEGEFPRAEQYLSLLRETDAALEKLINYFSAEEEPVIILFFGDHQPSLETELYELLYGKTEDELSLEEKQRKYLTPFFIWSNRGLEAEDLGDTSINYLGGLLLETAGLRTSDFTAWLSGQSREYPVVNANGAVTADGEFLTLSEAELSDYDMLQYNFLFEEEGYLTDFFGINLKED